MTSKEKASVSPMLEDWHDFYILLGTAAAALVALLFVAASIGASMLTPERTRATRTYLSLVVFHCGDPVCQPHRAHSNANAALARHQRRQRRAHRLALFCLLPVVPRPRRRHRRLLGYGGCPAAAYAAALISACLFKNQSAAAVNVVAGAFMVLLVVNIRNAWDLFIALARRSNEERGKAG
jgi:hypothetical protein